MRLYSVLLAILVLPVAACVTTNGAPLPDDIAIVKPDESVPTQKAAFSGKWEGSWDGRLASRLVVEEITATKADVIYAWGQIGNVAANWRRYEATFKGDELTFKTPRPSTVSFKRRTDGTLEARYTWSGGLSKALFVRSPEEK